MSCRCLSVDLSEPGAVATGRKVNSVCYSEPRLDFRKSDVWQVATALGSAVGTACCAPTTGAGCHRN